MEMPDWKNKLIDWKKNPLSKLQNASSWIPCVPFLALCVSWLGCTFLVEAACFPAQIL